jgi:menaquinone-dependent protoporphyrinogen oxidase
MSPMRALVVAASRHEATREIAEAIGRTLERQGIDASVRRVEEVEEIAGYDAVVVGSAIYAGRWLQPAVRFVRANAVALRELPVWAFSSGPVGDPPRPTEGEAVRLDEILELTRAREHRVFAGRLDKGRLGWGERAIVRVFGAAEGDFRDWGAIDGWAQGIADALSERGGGSISP